MPSWPCTRGMARPLINPLLYGLDTVLDLREYWSSAGFWGPLFLVPTLPGCPWGILMGPESKTALCTGLEAAIAESWTWWVAWSLLLDPGEPGLSIQREKQGLGELG